MLKCMRVEDIQGKKRYFCIDSTGNSFIFDKPEIVKEIQQGRVVNASTFLRNGVICVRVDDAIKEKIATSTNLSGDQSLENKIIEQIIRKMKSGVVYFNMPMSRFLDELDLPEFKTFNEALSMNPKDLVIKAKDLCKQRGQQAYIMGLQADEGYGYEVIFATTNRQRGALTIQTYIKNKVINAACNENMTSDGIKEYLDQEQKKIILR